MIADIITPRLTLRHLTPAVLELCAEGQHERAAALMGFPLPPEWDEDRALYRWRLKDQRDDPAYESWSLRAVVLTAEGRVIGHAGFHTTPGADYIKPYADGGIEFGYTIFPAHRGQGFASEVARAFMAYAKAQGVPRFALSIRPDNAPSLAIVKKLGFVRVGEHLDPIDGLEWIFAREA